VKIGLASFPILKTMKLWKIEGDKRKMTKEELEKEAIAKYKTGSYPQLHPDHWAFVHGYLAGAEPKEKRIVELEQQIEKMKYALNKIIKTVQNDNISGYGDRLVIIYDISCEVLQEIKENE
jgi:hypothetical protein